MGKKHARTSRVILAAGGTGGHLYPAISIADNLTNNGAQVVFLVSNRGIERQILEQHGYPYLEQRITGFMGGSALNKVRSLYSIMRQSLALMGVVRKGDTVIVFGGFVSMPAASVAILKGCPLYIHEQNAVMGRANKLLSKYARTVFLSYPRTQAGDGGNGDGGDGDGDGDGKFLVTGNPIRNLFSNIQPNHIPAVRPEGHTLNILVLGGSQGSRFINNLIIHTVSHIANGEHDQQGNLGGVGNLGAVGNLGGVGRIQVMHQAGGKLYDETLQGYSGVGVDVIDGVNNVDVDDIANTNSTASTTPISVHVAPYIDDMFSAYEWSHIVVSRSGSSSVFESLQARRPCVFIPFAKAIDNHQYHNAEFISHAGAGVILTELEATPENLINSIHTLVSNYDSVVSKLSSIGVKNSSEIIANHIFPK